MAVLTLVQQPAHFASAYKPVLWSWTSQRAPLNSIAGETVAIGSIRVATAGDVITFGSPLAIGDVFVLHATVTAGTWKVGQAIKITGTTAGLYSGIYHVLKIVNTGLTVIDAAPAASPDSGGTIAKFYEAYHLTITVDMDNLPAPIVKRIVADPAGAFTIDLSDIAKRSFKDVFSIAVPGSASAIIPSNGYITQSYQLTINEAFMIPDTNGLNVYTEFGKAVRVNPDRDVVVNSVQPYHNTADNVQLKWTDDLSNYEVSIATIDPRKQFLTYAQKGELGTVYHPQTAMIIGSEEDYFLAFLNAGTPGDYIGIRLYSYDADGVQLGTHEIPSVLPPYSGLIPIGPLNLTTNLDLGVHHYRVSLRNNTTNLDVTDPFYFTIDTKCHNAVTRRFFWLNPFGTIDAYTSQGKESRETDIKRHTIEKPHMRIDLATTRGDWQRRTYKSDIVRRYSSTTDVLIKDFLRYLADDLLESPDVRMTLVDGIWTYVIMDTNKAPLGDRRGRLQLDYFLGVDNGKQQR